ncbi:MAG: acyl-CoA dehydrogenase family protein [Pseudomonadales bacterium]
MSIAKHARATNYDLSFSDEQSMLLESARDFCRDKSTIAAVRALLDGDTGFDAGVWQEMVALGWLGIAIPEQYGGSELGIGSTVPIAETMGRYMLSPPYFSATLAAQAIVRGGSSAQKEEWLPKIAEGCIGTLALLENEDWGNDAISCNAIKEGGEVRLAGSKQFVSDAAVADFFIVSVNYKNAPALVIVKADQLTAGAMHAKVLIDETKRASSVDFTGADIAPSAILDVGKAVATLRDLKLLGALLVAAEATGSSAATLDCIVDYLKTRKQFGKLIGSYQALKHPTVDILTGMDSARSLLYHAATVTGDEPLDADTEIACRMAKTQATDTLLFAGDRAVQFHGGMGFTYECDAQLYLRRAQWSQQHFGDAYHHRKRLAALLLDH